MAVSVEQARAFLNTRFGAVSALKPLSGGDWSQAFAFDSEQGHFVARFSTVDEDFLRDHFAATLNSAALPIPRMVELGKALDGYYAVTERASGTFLDDTSAEQLRLLLPALFAALDAARTADVSGSHGYGSWDAAGNGMAPSWQAALLSVSDDDPRGRLGDWKANLRAFPDRLRTYDSMLQRFAALVPSMPELRHVIHSDLLHYNVLVDGSRINAVFDWGCGMYGDYLYDIAWFTFWWPWFPAWHTIDFKQEVRRHFDALGLDVSALARRLQCYEAHIGMAHLVYNSYTQGWDEFDKVATRMHTVFDGAQ